MGWRETQPRLYMRSRSTELSAAERAENNSDHHRDDYSMDEYREFVERVADGEWPSETILNRSAEHAAVIIENLFRKADRSVEVLTSELKPDVYAMSAVINSAIDFLRRDEDAQIHILCETSLDRSSHPFLTAIDAAQLGDRLTVRTIDPTAKQEYKFNFAVADAKSFRFEESRDSFEAIVGFGHEKFANRLHNVFGVLATTSA